MLGVHLSLSYLKTNTHKRHHVNLTRSFQRPNLNQLNNSGNKQTKANEAVSPNMLLPYFPPLHTTQSVGAKRKYRKVENGRMVRMNHFIISI